MEGIDSHPTGFFPSEFFLASEGESQFPFCEFWLECEQGCAEQWGGGREEAQLQEQAGMGNELQENLKTKMKQTKNMSTILLLLSSAPLSCDSNSRECQQ